FEGQTWNVDFSVKTFVKTQNGTKTDWTFFWKFARFEGVSPNEILQDILKDVRDLGSCAAVFDLDSTLFCVSPRSQAILHDWANEEWFRGRFPDASQVLAKVVVHPTEYGIKASLIRAGLEATPELIDTVRSYWRSKFFGNSHMKHDLIYPGAQDFVNKVHA